MLDQVAGQFSSASLDNRRKAPQLIVEYMVEANGGPAYYGGRDMKQAHAGPPVH
jgi:hypothetical protein